MTKKKKKLGFYSKMLIIGIIIFLIPFLALGYLLIESSSKSSYPNNGERFNDELNPAITASDVENVKAKICAIDGVESIDSFNINSGAVRIYVKIQTSDVDDMINKAWRSYWAVDELLPIKEYFSNHDGIKMYDLSVYVYNETPSENNSENYFSYILSKNAYNAEPTYQVLSSPKDKDSANIALKTLEETDKTPTIEGTIGEGN